MDHRINLLSLKWVLQQGERLLPLNIPTNVINSPSYQLGNILGARIIFECYEFHPPSFHALTGLWLREHGQKLPWVLTEYTMRTSRRVLKGQTPEPIYNLVGFPIRLNLYLNYGCPVASFWSCNYTINNANHYKKIW